MRVWVIVVKIGISLQYRSTEWMHKSATVLADMTFPRSTNTNGDKGQSDTIKVKHYIKIGSVCFLNACFLSYCERFISARHSKDNSVYLCIFRNFLFFWDTFFLLTLFKPSQLLETVSHLSNRHCFRNLAFDLAPF